MNLYKLHSNPEKLYGGDGDIDVIPIVAVLSTYNYQTSDDEFFELHIMNQIKEIGRRVPEIEKAILKMGDDGVYLMVDYAEIMMDDERWPEAEPFIMASDYAEDYLLVHPEMRKEE